MKKWLSGLWKRARNIGVPEPIKLPTPVPISAVSISTLVPAEIEFLALLEASEQSPLFELPYYFLTLLSDCENNLGAFAVHPKRGILLKLLQPRVLALLQRGLLEVFRRADSPKSPDCPQSREEAIAVINSDPSWFWPVEENATVFELVLTDAGMELLHAGYAEVSPQRRKDLMDSWFRGAAKP